MNIYEYSSCYIFVSIIFQNKFIMLIHYVKIMTITVSVCTLRSIHFLIAHDK